MTETERVNGLPNKQHVTLSRRSCVSMWLNFQLTLYTGPVPVSDEFLHLRGRFLASFQLRFSCLSADRSVAKQRRQVSVTAAVACVLSRSLTQSEWSFCEWQFSLRSDSCSFLMSEVKFRL